MKDLFGNKIILNELEEIKRARAKIKEDLKKSSKNMEKKEYQKLKPYQIGDNEILGIVIKAKINGNLVEELQERMTK